ncbi:peptidylprolyl isomerase [Salisediminibacterium halotolerans]|uniref:Peptidyl-prolyl cis-trans isomerase n=1 Tax=Salisediminibacterium halotolerans TaxID=517425 RepID=A0A1H9RW34_9BACI|nr:peptidylprolyl isomerase [Salisediminibacterium haloalkalitolerans]SER76645.1 peptidyl-prolyl cis-trans isomerase B (cyclophilin B) [Salisediminibacterium haloalkalitolerans]
MKKYIRTISAAGALAGIGLIAGCADSYDDAEINHSDSEAGSGELPQLTEEAAENEAEAVMSTNHGEIHLKLFPEAAPKAVENFITLSEDGYYDGVIFHRVIEDFMIQGGDPEGTGMGGESAFGEPFEDEFDDSVYHFNGALSMANSGPDTNASQFFIVHADEVSEDILQQMADQYDDDVLDAYEEKGGTPNLDDGHTVFGHVIDGMDTVNSIAEVPTAEQDRPEEEVVIEEIEIISE